MSMCDTDRQILRNYIQLIRKKNVSNEEIDHLFSMFGSLGGILEAGEHMLEKAGIHSREAHMLSLIPEISRYARRTSESEHPVFRSLTSVARYLTALYMGVHIERFHVLCLNDGGRLLRCSMLQEGTVDESPFYLDSLLRCAINNKADGVILSHNHPAGNLYPSDSDISSTKLAIDALNVMGIFVLDHVIVAAGRCVSMRQNGYMDVQRLSDTRASGLYQGWLE